MSLCYALLQSVTPDVSVIKGILSFGVPGVLLVVCYGQYRQNCDLRTREQALVDQMRADAKELTTAYTTSATSRQALADTLDGLPEAVQKLDFRVQTIAEKAIEIEKLRLEIAGLKDLLLKISPRV